MRLAAGSAPAGAGPTAAALAGRRGAPAPGGPRRRARAPPAAAAAEAPKAAAGSDAAGGAAKAAVAAKISAARSLARKLAEEQAAGGAEIEAEVAASAAAAARADAAARAAVRSEAGAAAGAGAAELARLKAENEGLQALLLRLAADRREAETALEALRAAPAAEAAAEAPAAPAAAPAAPKPPSPGGEAAAAKAARAAGRRAASAPGPAPPGAPARLVYNAEGGPLAGADDDAELSVKAGFNAWAEVARAPLRRAPALDAAAGGGRWWAGDLPLPRLLHRVDFVVEAGGATDNNERADFALALAGAPSAAEVLAAQLALLEGFEAGFAARFEAEEAAAAEARLRAAAGAAEEARLAALAASRAALEAEAAAAVEERRGGAAAAPGAADALPGVYAFAPAPAAGAAALLCYNKAGGPLAAAPGVDLHLGYDGWWMRDARVTAMRPLAEAEARRHKAALAAAAPAGGAPAEWWAAPVAVWATAAQLDFSFAAPGAGAGAPAAWDDGAGAGYHAPVAGAPSGARLAALVLSALAAAGAGEEAAAADAARRRALRKAELKAAAAAARARALRSRLFTDPSAPRAGAPVTVYYNPDRTVLRGRPDVYARGGFDRRAGGGAACFLPAKMAPAVPEAGGLGWLAATLDLPADASVLDLTFLDAPDAHGGFADANGGRGYVLEVVGGRGAPPAPLRVAHVAAEMAPIAKAGGLGDVVTALGRAVQEEGHAVEIVLPKYDCLNYALVEGLVLVGDFFVGNVQVKAWRGRVEGLVTTFLEPTDGSVWVGAIYTEMGRDRGRFGLFCAAALEWLTRHAPEGRPDVVHAHDWQSAPVLAGARAAGAAAAFTIHNLNYGADLIGLGMAEADVATTVSPTYASEVAGHPSVAPHLEKFVGVRNGIDFDAWDPETDAALPRNYAVADAAAGKAAAKAELRARLGLAEGAVPLVAVVTRLTHQKGVHLIKHAAWRAAERGAQFVLLGSAPDPKVQAEFEALAEDLRRAYPDRARLWFAYDEPLSHLIYAAADLLLVPSIFEPCGLTQMIAMRYGAVPVVRRTGGLADTVFDLDDDAARAAAAGLPMNGFSFDGADAAGLDYALNRALDAWYDRPLWEGLVERVMSLDWSWAGPAREYVDLYYRAVQRAG